MVEQPGISQLDVSDRLQSLLLNLRDLPPVLAQLAQLAAAVVTDAPTSCGITLRYDNNLLTVGSSDHLAEALDETQYRSGNGPCLQALRTNLIVDVPDVHVEHRWPGYLPRAAEAGLRCSLSLPLTIGNDTFGAMNVYGFERARLFGEAQRRQLIRFADQASGTLQIARRMAKDGALLEQFEEALDSRSVIDQALGIIMAQQRCTASAAFDLLRSESQNNHRRVRDVATDLVTRVTGAPPEPGPELGR